MLFSVKIVKCLPIHTVYILLGLRVRVKCTDRNNRVLICQACSGSDFHADCMGIPVFIDARAYNLGRFCLFSQRYWLVLICRNTITMGAGGQESYSRAFPRSRDTLIIVVKAPGTTDLTLLLRHRSKVLNHDHHLTSGDRSESARYAAR